MGLVRVCCALDFFQDMITKGWNAKDVKCITGLPKGAQFIKIESQVLRNPAQSILLYFIFEHPDFPRVEAHQELPYVNVTFEQNLLGEEND
jgi:hypothetical protein